jgi:hypothetical protein
MSVKTQRARDEIIAKILEGHDDPMPEPSKPKPKPKLDVE